MTDQVPTDANQFSAGHNAPQLVMRAVADLMPHPRRTRTHSKGKLDKLTASVRRFGLNAPLLIAGNVILAGHARLEAAKRLHMDFVPTLELSHLSPDEQRAYVIADNKHAANAGWDKEALAEELQTLLNLDFQAEDLGFDLAEIDLTLDEASDADPLGIDPADDRVPEILNDPVSQSGDLWLLGRHRLLCGDARSLEQLNLLMDGRVADIVFTDPPYNVKVDGHVCGLGSVKHREFAFASGEMSSGEFADFLTLTFSNAATVMRDGAIAFVCMDWRHISELLAAGGRAFTELKNLVVWNKTNGGMGSFYRSKHELIFVFKNGTARHTNSFGLGDTGRYRTNVWEYPGISSLGPSRADEIAMHPTVKPVALIADALRDCSRRGEVVLDLFGGSGSTLIAAHQTGRSANLVEYDPGYCDVIVKRWEQLFGKCATLAGTGQTFEEVAAARHPNNPQMKDAEL